MRKDLNPKAQTYMNFAWKYVHQAQYKDKLDPNSLGYFHLVDGMMYMQRTQRLVADCRRNEYATEEDKKKMEVLVLGTEQKYRHAFEIAIRPSLKLSIQNSQAVLAVEKIQFCQFDQDMNRRTKSVLQVANDMIAILKAAFEQYRVMNFNHPCCQVIHNMVNIVLAVHEVLHLKQEQHHQQQQRNQSNARQFSEHVAVK
eukprot:c2190_g1_i1.p1 GENE.c2190_g1_i1~~c2190_g1_i1.p1  ORF type:complete len:199 (+),score=51.97 c2190_g1_i1:393-989(+)